MEWEVIVFMRITRLGLFNIVLATVLLTSAFLMNAKLTTSVRQYDPWVDYNGDGTVNYLDVYSLLIAYGLSGDPTKNVTVVGHASKLLQIAYAVYIPPATQWSSGKIWIDGYAKITVLIALSGSATANSLSIFAFDSTGSPGWLVDGTYNFNGGDGFVKTYDVMNQQIEILVYNGGTQPYPVFVDVYLVA